MAVHSEKRVLPYTQQQVFDLVADVERYPVFLPWCIACRKTKSFDDGFEADLAIGFKMVRETFASRVIINEPDQVDVEYLDGPFKYLKNRWKFSPAPNGEGCEIDFYLEFEFRSVVLQKLIGVLFEEAVRRMVSAFENRAADLYG